MGNAVALLGILAILAMGYEWGWYAGWGFWGWTWRLAVLFGVPWLVRKLVLAYDEEEYTDYWGAVKRFLWRGVWRFARTLGTLSFLLVALLLLGTWLATGENPFLNNSKKEVTEQVQPSAKQENRAKKGGKKKKGKKRRAKKAKSTASAASNTRGASRQEQGGREEEPHEKPEQREAQEPEEDVRDDAVFTIVEEMPRFRGGDIDTFIEYVNREVVYPEEAAEYGIQGKVTVSFIVERDGSISNVKILGGVESSLDREAARVVKESPKWKPGLQQGKPARVSYKIPVEFYPKD